MVEEDDKPGAGSIRTYLSNHHIRPGTKLANFIHKTITTEPYKGADPFARAAFLRHEAFLNAGIKIEPLLYKYMMSVLHKKGTIDDAYFSEKEVADWRAARTELDTLRMSAEAPTELPGLAPPSPPPEIAVLQARIAFYEGILSSLCKLLGVPACPPTYADLLRRIANGL